MRRSTPMDTLRQYIRSGAFVLHLAARLAAEYGVGIPLVRKQNQQRPNAVYTVTIMSIILLKLLRRL